MAIPALPDIAARRNAQMAATWIITLAALMASFLFLFPVAVERHIDARSLRHSGGHAYATAITELIPVWHRLLGIEPDSLDYPASSRVYLLEQGARIGVPHSQHDEIAQLGGGRFSHWGNELLLSTPDNTDPRASDRAYAIGYLLRVPPWLVAALLLAAGIAWAALRRERGAAAATIAHPARVFWAGALLVAAYMNAVFVLLVPAPVPYPDTYNYLQWSLFRTLGYPALLHAFRDLSGSWTGLPLLQLNLVLAGVLMIAHALATMTKRYIVAWVFFLVTIGFGGMFVTSSEILTESAFAAVTMAHVAFMALLLAQHRRSWALLAGLALAAAILIKSVAVTLLGPLLVVLAALPGRRRPIATLVLAPALAAWLVPSATNLARFGFFESSAAGGYALAGHVAWAIEPRPGSPFAADAEIFRRALRPVIDKRPAHFDTLDRYIDYTAGEYNTLLWGRIYPELQKRYTENCPSRAYCSWKACVASCEVLGHQLLLGIAKETIAAEPLSYVRHVAAHDYGLWRDVLAHGEGFLHGTSQRAQLLPAHYTPQLVAALAPPLPFPSEHERADVVARIDQSAAKRVIDVLTFQGLPEALARRISRDPWILIALGVVAGGFFVRLPRATPLEATWCYTGLCLNAYFLGTALAQPAILRYAWPMQGLVALLLVAGGWLAGIALLRRWRRGPVESRMYCRSAEESPPA